MKYCPMCGRPHHDSVFFCGFCGARFPEHIQKPENMQTPTTEYKPFNYPLAWIIAAASAVVLCLIAMVIS